VIKHSIATLVIALVAAWTLIPRAAYSHNPTTTTVLFNREITTLLQRKCVQCHAEGKLAMPLITFAQTRPWAEAIKEETLSRRMPPWPAERGFGTYSNDIGLTPREFEFLISWIDGGVPIGDGNPPGLVDHAAHWTLGDPDMVVSPRAATAIDARSAPAFRRVLIDTGLTRETWIRGFDFKPDPRVARAAFLSIEGTDRYLGGWTPWQSSTELPRDAGIRLPARARIAVDVLYAGAAQPQSDTPQLALYVAKETPANNVTTSMLRPARTAERAVAEVKFADARALISMRPDMPAGTRSLEVKLRRPDGSSDVLLWIKEFRQDWQTPYVFARPVAVPAGSVVQAIAHGEMTTPFTVYVNHYATR